MAARAESTRTLVVATTNRGKLKELRSLLARLPIDVRGMAEIVPDPPRVAEDGATFADNAIKKARAAAAVTGMLSLADDSCLEVDALGGRPGVRSARFAHEHATDAENNAALLAALSDLDHARPDRVFRARFRCVLALVDPRSSGWSGRVWTVEGVCEGTIARVPRGSSGFGYDPMFIVAGTGKSMAEIGHAEKNRVSHRARAVAALRPVLERLAE
jgi:XTP/dITP diphosphohydrolase